MGWNEVFKSTKDGKPVRSLELCNCKKSYLNEVRAHAECRRRGINPDFLTYSTDCDYLGSQSRDQLTRLENYVAAYPTSIAHQRAMVYIWGGNGTQKTSIAKWVAASLIKARKKVVYVLMNDLIRHLIDAERDESKRDVTASYYSADLLIIDESFDKTKVTIYESGFQIPFLDSFLRKRFESGLGIMFVSNVPPDSIEKNKYSRSIQDFVYRNLAMTKTVMEFKDNYINQKEEIDFSTGGLF